MAAMKSDMSGAAAVGGGAAAIVAIFDYLHIVGGPDEEIIRKKERLKEVVDALADYDEINAKFAEPMSAEEMDALIEKQGKLQDELDGGRS